MSFDTLAPHYRWMEFLLAGRKLQDCRVAFLHQAGSAKNILILGEGNGRFLTACAKQFPDARISCVDGSERMLHFARRRIQRNGLSLERINFIHADALAWQPSDHKFDLIVTHFFLDCFREDQLQNLIAQIAPRAMPHAKWLLADFQLPADGLRHFRASIIMQMMYAFFRVATRLPAREWVCPDEILKRNGFALRERRVSDWGLLHSDLWENTASKEPHVLQRERNHGVAVRPPQLVGS